MKNLFEAAKVKEVKERIALLKPQSQRQWGKMNAAQAVAHCAAGLELALGDRTPPRLLLGRIIGGIIKPKALGDDLPMRRNSPTVKGLVVLDQRDLASLEMTDAVVMECDQHPGQDPAGGRQADDRPNPTTPPDGSLSDDQLRSRGRGHDLAAARASLAFDCQRKPLALLVEQSRHDDRDLVKD